MNVTKIPVNTNALSSKRRSAIKTGINNVFLRMMDFFYENRLGNSSCYSGVSLFKLLGQCLFVFYFFVFWFYEIFSSAVGAFNHQF
jgi:hypothetical protein